MATTNAAKAVEAYLKALKDPSTVIDSEAAESIQAEIDSTDDLLEQARLYERLRGVKDTDTAIDRVRQGFIQHAKAWAESQEPTVTADTFREHLGVPNEVLAEAGFETSVKARKKSTQRRSSSGPRGSREEVLKRIEGMSKSAVFKYNDLVADVNASIATVRAAVKQALDDKLIEEEGPDPEHDGRGRAPMVFRKK